MKRVINSLHWCHRMFWYSFAVVAILLAIAISLIRIFITDVKDYRHEIESFASSVLEQEVRIDSMDAKLSGFTPLIVFNGVRMLDHSGKKQLVRFEEARLTIDPIRSISELRIVPKGFTVYGVSLGINRKDDGTLQIQDLNLAELGDQFSFKSEANNAESAELADWLFKRSDLAIKNSTVIWQDEADANKTIKFENVNFYIRNDDERHQLTGTVTLPPELGQDFEIAFDFMGNLLNPREWRGDFYTKGKSLNVKNWNVKPVVLSTQLLSGTVDVSMWGKWRAGTIQALAADFTANAFQAVIGEEQHLLNINHLGGLVNWQRTAQGWTLNVDRFMFDGNSGPWPQSRIQFAYTQNELEEQRVKAVASYFRLQDAGDLLTRTHILPEEIKSKILKLNPQGEIKNLILHSTLDKDRPAYRVNGELHNITVSPYEKFPGISHFSGVIEADQNGGHARITAADGVLALPTLFREPIALRSFDADLNWWHDDQQWYLQSSDIQLANDDIRGSLSVSLVLPEAKVSPYLDLQLDYHDGQGKSVSKYLPVTIMDKDLVTWLDRAIKSGTVTHGGFVFNGRLADFPFRRHNGIMLADFYTRDVEIDYQPGWPMVVAKDGHVMISGLGLDVMARTGKLYDSQLKNVRVKIDKFALPKIDIKGAFNGRTRDLFHYLVNSPIAKEAQGIYQHAKISGDVSGQVDIHIPLSKKARAVSPFDYIAQATLKDSRLDLWDNKLVFEDIAGDVTYKPKQVTSKGLKATVLDQDVKLKLFSRVNPESEEIILSMRGKLDAGKLRHHINSPLMEKLSGITSWQGALSLGARFSDGSSKPGYFHFSSPLQGMASELPAPFSKQAGIKKTLNVEVKYPKQDVLPVYVKLGSEMSSALAININPDADALLQKGSIAFRDEKAKLPEKYELKIRGSIPSLPISEWDKLFKRDGAEQKVDVTDLKLPIELDLDYLKIVTDENEANKPAKDPGKVSLLNGEIRKFEYNAMKLGKVNIHTLREKDGIRIEKLTVAGDHLSLSGDGRWTLRGGNQLTNLIMKVSSDNFGALLGDLGYSATIRKGKLQSVIQAHWYDAPTNFSLATLYADVGAVINDGVISEVEPGAGRLLGLLSLSELPRRLSLDFKELQNGLAFSQIIGQVEVNRGHTRIETLKVVSPVALMQIEGSTNLVDKTFDQTVRVVPNVSGTVPFVSWLALGGQVGAIAFLFDQMFGDTFDDAIGIEYLVTGTWEHPIITKVPPTPPANDPDFN